MRIKMLFFIFLFAAFCTFYAKQATFFLLDVFMDIKNAVFFVFIRLYAFWAFCVCEIFL